MSTQVNTTARSLQNSRVKVTRGDVTVEKRVDTGYDDFVGIEITVSSRSDRTLTVGVYDEVPGQIDENDVGFHPGFDPENWANNGSFLRYKTELDPGETRETVYAVRQTNLRALRALMAPPVVRIATR